MTVNLKYIRRDVVTLIVGFYPNIKGDLSTNDLKI